MEDLVQFLQGIWQSLYDAWVPKQRYLAYFNGLKVTIQISLMAILIGVIIGTLVAVIKVSLAKEKKFRFLSVICDLYINIIRGTPVMLQLLIFYNLIFVSRNSNSILVGGICFGINSGAYVAEVIRAGIEAVDKGQTEAGRSLGLNTGQTMWLIVLPQAVKNILPALGNEFIVLIKETSVASVIAVNDLLNQAQYIGNSTYQMLPPLFIAAAFYLLMVLGFTKLLKFFERRMSQGDHY